MTAAPEDKKPTVATQPQGPPASPPQQQQPPAASPGKNSTPAPNNAGRKISCEDIQLVQNLIERCLQLYMNQGEVVDTLKYHAKIEPGFTGLVWQKLEEQNPDFFKAYYTRLKVKKQIMLFNHLLEQQVHLMQKIRVYPQMNPMVQGMHPSQMHHMQMAYPMPPGPPNAVRPMMGPIPMQVPNPTMMNGANPVHQQHQQPQQQQQQQQQQEYVPPHGGDGSAAMFPFSNMGNPTDITGGMQMGLNSSMGLDAPMMPGDSGPAGIDPLALTNVEPDPVHGRESLETLPRNFSLSDLTAELTSTGDLGGLGNYTGSPYLTPDSAENYIQDPGSGDFPDLDDDDDKMMEDVENSLTAHLDNGK